MSDDDSGTGTGSWLPLLRRSRSVWLLAATALSSLIVGSVASAVVISSQDAGATAAVEAGPITIPIERRIIVNEIRTRGTAAFADAFDLTVDPSLLPGTATVSGRVPRVGDTIEGGSVLLEIAGRPVIALPGDVPSYRDLRVGTTGADVAALKSALASLGIDPGDAASATFDAATASAIDALYERVGYDRPLADEDAADALSSAESAVRSADLAVLSAERDLSTVRAGASAVERAEADAAVREAESSLATAHEGGVAAEVATAENALTVAKARRDEAVAQPDERVEAAALHAARADADQARARLERARAEGQVFLPASEVAFVPGLPRRVDTVGAVKGRPLEASAMTMSGATLAVDGDLATSEAGLVAVGAAVTLTLADGTSLTGTISKIGASVVDGASNAEQDDADQQETGTGGVTFSVTPQGDEQQLAALAGQNVRVTVPIESTEGEVWAVPVAALSTGPDGASRIEVARDGERETSLVEVQLGLAADGFVEITSAETELTAQLRVVVGE
ncbi:hypothetical protein ACFXQA_14855 [Microbacterium sp. P07]|uniref:hypothetical protein n=1 Tax=Microbacterium sp. P07 TaxID=3366952 RepID=UPI0037467E4D